MLNLAHAGLGDNVVRDPSEEEREVVKLSKLLWAYAPQVHDNLDPKDFSPVKLRTLLHQAGLADETIDSAREVESQDHQTTWVLPNRWREGATGDEPQIKYIFWNVTNPAKLVNILRSGAMGSTERIMTGAGFFGQDGGAEMRHGLDGMTVRLVTKHHQGEMTTNYGSFHIIIPPDETDRLDVGPLYTGDMWGCLNPNDTNAEYREAFKNRKPLQKAVASSYFSGKDAELVIRKGVNPKRILRIACHSESYRQTLLKELRAQGMTEINGVPIEDFVITEPTFEGVHSKIVKAAGY
jgi:hypothetical protein